MNGPGDTASKPLSSKEPMSSSGAEGHVASPNNAELVTAILPGSESSARHEMSFAQESGDLSGVSMSTVDVRQAREGNKPQSEVVAAEESDEAIVPKKPAKTRVTPVESVEGRAEAKGKSAVRNALPTQGGDGALTQVQWIGRRAEWSLSPLTRGGSPVREIRSPGSVRGVARTLVLRAIPTGTQTRRTRGAATTGPGRLKRWT